MFRFITIKVIALVVIFCFLNGHAKSPTIDISDDVGVAAIVKAYPASDERHQFAIAGYKAGGLFTKGAKGDIFEVRHIFLLIRPFLKSRNENIKLCAEEIIRFAKLTLVFFICTESPDDSSCEEVRGVLNKMSMIRKKMTASYENFLGKSIPMQQLKALMAIEDAKSKKVVNQ